MIDLVKRLYDGIGRYNALVESPEKHMALLAEAANEIDKLRKIAVRIPASVYIKAKESAGFGEKIVLKKTTDKITYVVIDDYDKGDNTWKVYPIAFGPFKTRRKAEEKAEAENYHSASIVKCVNGKRIKKVGP